MRLPDVLRRLAIVMPLLTYSFVQCSMTNAADQFDQQPINYRDGTPNNCVSQLQVDLDSGNQSIVYEGEQGYLSSLLDALKVPTESQMLVFSKTSLQRHRISPGTPRAIYFNEDVYVGYCQSGDVLEISAVDPQLGAVFYTLDQTATDHPKLERRNDNCMVCHSSSRTGGVPGHVIRSLYVDAGGRPIYSAGSRMVDHTTPIEDRWGGWYVTGTHGKLTHVGNLVMHTNRVSEPVDNAEGQNLLQLNDRIQVERYISPHSDIVALMILEHQALVHNRLTKANFETRQALHYQKIMNEALGYDENNRLESTNRRIASAGDDLVEALLLVDEAPLTSVITGTSGYAEVFAASGRRDRLERSLRDLDLTRRIFKYPCSYLIYSEPFDGLPKEMRDYVWQRLWGVLSGKDQSEEFNHLSASDRSAIAEIIHDTKSGLPAFWAATPDRRVSFAVSNGRVRVGE